MKLPTHPIERVYVTFPGEPGAGIPARGYELTCFVDLARLPVLTRLSYLRDMRERVSALYADLLDGDGQPRHLQVLFDFECEEQADEALNRTFTD